MDFKIEWSKTMFVERECAIKSFQHPRALIRRGFTIDVRLIPPNEGTFKINIDGVSKGRNAMTTVAGVIRDWSGQWVIGIAKNQGSMPPLSTKRKVFSKR